MHQFKKLEFWIRSCAFCTEIYKETINFPAEEKFGIINQLRRASVSIALNIAEGASRSSNKDFARFLEIALGSAFEVQTQLIISNNLEFIDEEKYNQLNLQIESIIKQMRKFKSTLI